MVAIFRVFLEVLEATKLPRLFTGSRHISLDFLREGKMEMFQIEVCANPSETPREWETASDRFKYEADVISRHEEFSQAYRNGKLFRVVSSDATVVDMQEFLFFHS